MNVDDSSNQLFAELMVIYDICAAQCHGLAPVNQRMHAVQAGALAKSRRLPTALVVAALLHDIGDMVDTVSGRGRGNRHEEVGADWLARFFGPQIVEPVRLHVAAKRYLCTTRPGYVDRLSLPSVDRLDRQGGFMSEAEIAEFKTRSYWREAILLRLIDDSATDPDGPRPPFASFWIDIESCLRTEPAVA